MYESPIEVFTNKIVQDIEERTNGAIIKECVRIGVNVNKEELLKALLYDRGQYERGRFDGYMSGYDAAMETIVHCRDCKWRYKDGDNVVVNYCLLNHNKVQSDDWFCADGERRDDEEEETPGDD